MVIKFGKYKLIVFLRTTKYSSKYDKDRLRRYQDKRRRLGLCRVCGVRVDDINKATKKRFGKCKKCRIRENKLKKNKRKKI